MQTTKKLISEDQVDAIIIGSSITPNSLAMIDVVSAAGTPAALPPKTLTQRGYKGKVYHNHGVGNRDFLRVCGADCNGTFLPTSPVLVASQLPDDHPAKRLALDYIKLYEAKQGAGTVSAFGSYAWDAGMLLQRAVPVALKAGAPGTPAFRGALRSKAQNSSPTPTGRSTCRPTTISASISAHA